MNISTDISAGDTPLIDLNLHVFSVPTLEIRCSDDEISRFEILALACHRDRKLIPFRRDPETGRPICLMNEEDAKDILYRTVFPTEEVYAQQVKTVTDTIVSVNKFDKGQDSPQFSWAQDEETLTYTIYREGVVVAKGVSSDNTNYHLDRVVASLNRMERGLSDGEIEMLKGVLRQSLGGN